MYLYAQCQLQEFYSKKIYQKYNQSPLMNTLSQFIQENDIVWHVSPKSSWYFVYILQIFWMPIPINIIDVISPPPPNFCNLGVKQKPHKQKSQLAKL